MARPGPRIISRYGSDWAERVAAPMQDSFDSLSDWQALVDLYLLPLALALASRDGRRVVALPAQ